MFSPRKGFRPGRTGAGRNFVARNAQAAAANFTDSGVEPATFRRRRDSSGNLLGPFVGVLTILAVAQVGSLLRRRVEYVTFTAGE
jgi:hypothetical protein